MQNNLRKLFALLNFMNPDYTFCYARDLGVSSFMLFSPVFPCFQHNLRELFALLNFMHSG